MKRFVAACLSSVVFAFRLGGQEAVPEIAFTASADVVKLPAGRHFGEVAGIAMNSTRHVFVFGRTGQRSTVHGSASSQDCASSPHSTVQTPSTQAPSAAPT